MNLDAVEGNTYYYFNGHYLIWVTGPFKGKVDVRNVSSIRRAEHWSDINAIIKPMLSYKCLLIRYAKYDELPVSPDDEKDFLESLIAINSQVQLNFSASDQPEA